MACPARPGYGSYGVQHPFALGSIRRFNLQGKNNPFCPSCKLPSTRIALFFALTNPPQIMAPTDYHRLSEDLDNVSITNDEKYEPPKKKSRVKRAGGVLAAALSLGLYTAAVLYYAQEVIHKPYCPRFAASDTVHLWVSLSLQKKKKRFPDSASRDKHAIVLSRLPSDRIRKQTGPGRVQADGLQPCHASPLRRLPRQAQPRAG